MTRHGMSTSPKSIHIISQPGRAEVIGFSAWNVEVEPFWIAPTPKVLGKLSKFWHVNCAINGAAVLLQIETETPVALHISPSEPVVVVQEQLQIQRYFVRFVRIS